jgi:hypothetical protein
MINGLTDVLKSPSVWTGKDGVNAVTDLLKNPPLQDKIQLGMIKSSYNTLVETGQIVIPGTDKKAPTGQLYNAAANAGKSLISATAGLVSAPKELSNLPTAGLSNIAGDAAGKLTGALGGAAGALGGAAGALGGAGAALSGAVGRATGALGGALSGGLSGAAGAVSNITGNLPSVSSLANRGTAELGGLLATASKFGVGQTVDWAKGAAGNLASGAKGAMDSLAKQGQFAVNFSDFKLPAAVAGIVPAAGFKGTIDRSTLNAATAKLIGSEKIPLPSFSPQSVDTSALTSAASKAKGLLSGGLDASGLLSKATGGIPGAGALAGLAGGIPGAGALSNLAGSIPGASKLTGALSTAYSGTDSNLLSRVGLSPDPLAAIKAKIG